MPRSRLRAFFTSASALAPCMRSAARLAVRLVDRALLMVVDVVWPVEAGTRSGWPPPGKAAGPCVGLRESHEHTRSGVDSAAATHAGPKLSNAQARAMIDAYEASHGETMAVWPLEDLRDVSGWN